MKAPNLRLCMTVSLSAAPQEKISDLVLTGHSDRVPITQMSGKSYVELKRWQESQTGR
ncbi:MAG: hypothetical protein ACRD40_01795 [Candidatus Acidiferrales bacterium]